MTRGCLDCGRDNDNGTHTALEQTGHLSHRYNPRGELEGMVADQMVWSLATFGPGDREKGVIKHIIKELAEIEQATNPADKLGEWIDVTILALDGAWRSGADPAAVVSALLAKYAKNSAREWPDWRTADPDAPIEHVAGVHD